MHFKNSNTSILEMSNTPFDEVVAHIRNEKYHNHRREHHSDIVSEGIYAHLLELCPFLCEDVNNGIVKKWLNVATPGDRERNIDLFVGEPKTQSNLPELKLVRFCIENKSVITAHRNRTNRYDDLTKILSSMHAVRSETVLVATVLIGVAPRYLNVCDKIFPLYKTKKSSEFFESVVPRFSSGDESLWEEFDFAISKNTPNDIKQTIALFNSLPTRPPGLTHVKGFDFVMLVPVMVDNVNPPKVVRDNVFGIDVDANYKKMVQTVCTAYSTRWHSDRLGK